MAAPAETSLPGPLARELDAAALASAFGGGAPLAVFRKALQDTDAALRECFMRNEPIEDLVRGRARAIDQIIAACWNHFAGPIADSADLVAV
ncbi:MAG TPA: hypothetical protein VFY39_14905, partial [Gammaproteobacteria bacterium]|nr:hypothetical protein [Gammaproteobacteria bacterium]